MKVIYSKQSVKFLKKLDPAIEINLKKKISLLKRSLDQDGVIPFSEMGTFNRIVKQVFSRH